MFFLRAGGVGEGAPPRSLNLVAQSPMLLQGCFFFLGWLLCKESLEPKKAGLQSFPETLNPKAKT